MTASHPTSPTSTLHLDTERGWRGGERQVLWLAQALVRAGHRVIIAARPGEPLAERAAAAGIPVVSSRPRGELDLAAALALRRTIRRHAVQIVHAHTAHAVAVGALATWGTPTRLVASRRAAFPLRRNALTRWKYRRASAITAISSAAADLLAAGGVSRDRIEIIPDGVDLARIVEPPSSDALAELGIPPHAPLAVLVAALSAEKDPLTFVRAIAEARATTPTLHAALVGDGPLRPAVEREIAALGLTGVVHLAGYRDDADRWLAAASVAVLASRSEGLGSVLLDALAFGTAVAATAAGGIPDVVRDGSTGLLAPVGDAPALGRAIARLITDPALAAHCVAGGRRHVQSFAIDVVAARTAALYGRVLRAASSHPIG